MEYLQKWFWWGTHSRLAPMRKFAWLCQWHQKGSLAYFKLRITNVSVEGLDNKAKVVSQRAWLQNGKNFHLEL